ncbi:ester cyclase [Candidatus Bipolaricaulota bacterium]
MTKGLVVLLLAVLGMGVLGTAQTAVTPRTADGVLLFDNQTGMTVTGINILFEQDVDVDLANVVVVGGGNVTTLDVEGRSVWIDVEVEPEGTLSLGLSSEYVGAQIKTAHWFASMEEKNKIITLRLLKDFWNEGDLRTADELVSPDFILHDVSLFGDIVGIEAYKGFLGVWTSAFPDFQITVDQIFGDGDLVYFVSTASATHTGPLGAIPATGMPWKVNGIVVRRVVDGKIVETWQLNDMLSLLMQIGLVPPLQ